MHQLVRRLALVVPLLIVGILFVVVVVSATCEHTVSRAPSAKPRLVDAPLSVTEPTREDVRHVPAAEPEQPMEAALDESPSTAASDSETYSKEFRVVAEQDRWRTQPVSGALVMLTSRRDVTQQYRGLTDDAGIVRLQDLPADTYFLHVLHSRYVLRGEHLVHVTPQPSRAQVVRMNLSSWTTVVVQDEAQQPIREAHVAPTESRYNPLQALLDQAVAVDDDGTAILHGQGSDNEEKEVWYYVFAPGYGSRFVMIEQGERNVVTLAAEAIVQFWLVDAATNRPLLAETAPFINAYDDERRRVGTVDNVGDGSWRVAGLLAGWHELTLNHTGYEAHTELVELVAGRRHDLGTLRLFPLATITFQVRDANGAPAAGRRVFVNHFTDEDGATTDGAGLVRIAGVSTVTPAAVTVRDRESVTAKLFVPIFELRSGRIIEIQEDPSGYVTGRVLDWNGEPVHRDHAWEVEAGTWLMMESIDFRSTDSPAGTWIDLRESGSFQTGPLVPGTYQAYVNFRVAIEQPLRHYMFFQELCEPIDLAAGSIIDVTWRLPEYAATHRLRLVDRDGEPIRGAEVWRPADWFDEDPDEQARNAVTTNESGEFALTLTRYASRTVFVRVSPASTVWILQLPDDLAADGAIHELRLADSIGTGRLRVEVVDSRGRAVPSAYLRLHHPNGTISAASTSRVFANLAPGEYRVSVLPDDLLSRFADGPRMSELATLVYVQGDGEATARVVLAWPDWITVRLDARDPDGRSLPGGHLVTQSDWSMHGWGLSTPVLRNAPVTLRIRTRGYEDTEVTFTPTEDGQGVPVTLVPK